MAQLEADREDLFAEAIALIRRVELTVPGETEAIVAGSRASGGWSIYFGPDPCYHCDPEGRLRRAIASGHLYRTQGNTLAQLTRHKTGDEVVLQRTDLSDEHLEEFMQRFRAKARSLHEHLAGGSVEVQRQFPQGEDVVGMLESAIAGILAAWPQLAPAIPTRRK